MRPPRCVDGEYRNQAREVQNLIVDRFKGLRYLGIIDDQEYVRVLAMIRQCRECTNGYIGCHVNNQGMVVLTACQKGLLSTTRSFTTP